MRRARQAASHTSTRRRGDALCVGLLCSLVLAPACKLERRSAGAPILDAHKAAPLFVLEDERGQPLSLDDRLPHGPVVLYFYRGFW